MQILFELEGDLLVAQNTESPDETFWGIVQKISDDLIQVKFSTSFQADGRYNVRFTLNRAALRRQHQALEGPAKRCRRLLFPRGRHVPTDAFDDQPNTEPLMLFNPQIGSNEPQLQAVRAVLRMKRKAAPFIIIGPYALLIRANIQWLILFVSLDQERGKPLR